MFSAVFKGIMVSFVPWAMKYLVGVEFVFGVLRRFRADCGRNPDSMQIEEKYPGCIRLREESRAAP